MNRLPLLFAVGLLTILGLVFAASAVAEDKQLEWQLSPEVSVYLTNKTCPTAEHEKYPYIAYAINKVHRQAMPGCFTHRGNDIVIHWARTSDTDQANTIVPADFFLKPPKAVAKPKKQPAPPVNPQVT